MRRSVVPSVTMLLTLAACGEPTAVDPGPVVAPLAARTAADGNVLERSNDVVSFARPFHNACAGESVWGEGEVHVVRLRTRAGADGERELYHGNPRRVTGVGEQSGERYHMVGAETRVAVEEPDGEFTSSFVQIMRLVGEGSGQNLSVHAVLRSRVVDGSVVWEMERATSTCSG